MKLDILAIGAHPDDVEISAAGTLILHKNKGYKVGVIDLTEGELGTRGNSEIRARESIVASKIMGLDTRINLKFRDGFIQNDEQHQLELIKYIRLFKPSIILCNAENDRHPDHRKTAELVKDASFLSGLRKIKTKHDSINQTPWRPNNLYFYIQYKYIKPDIIVDVSPHYKDKMKAIKAHRSQFFDPNSNEPETVISKKNFLDMIIARDREFARSIHTEYAEGFTTFRTIVTNNLLDLI